MRNLVRDQGVRLPARSKHYKIEGNRLLTLSCMKMVLGAVSAGRFITSYNRNIVRPGGKSFAQSHLPGEGIMTSAPGKGSQPNPMLFFETIRGFQSAFALKA